jgi:hypothetical protein
MEIIFHFNDLEKMQLGSEITFDSLDFVTDQLRNLHLQELKPAVQEEESPSICIFLAGLEDVMLTSMLMRSLPNSAGISSSAKSVRSCWIHARSREQIWHHYLAAS